MISNSKTITLYGGCRWLRSKAQCTPPTISIESSNHSSSADCGHAPDQGPRGEVLGVGGPDHARRERRSGRQSQYRTSFSYFHHLNIHVEYVIWIECVVNLLKNSWMCAWMQFPSAVAGLRHPSMASSSRLLSVPSQHSESRQHSTESLPEYFHRWVDAPPPYSWDVISTQFLWWDQGKDFMGRIRGIELNLTHSSTRAHTHWPFPRWPLPLDLSVHFFSHIQFSKNECKPHQPRLLSTMG